MVYIWYILEKKRIISSRGSAQWTNKEDKVKIPEEMLVSRLLSNRLIGKVRTGGNILIRIQVASFGSFNKASPRNSLKNPSVYIKANLLLVIASVVITTGLVYGSASPFYPIEAKCFDSRNNDEDDDEVDQQRRHKDRQVLTRSFVADVVEMVSPAVVNIVCISNSYIGTAAFSGSGFILNREGYIVTNAHVVAASTDHKVVVTMHNGRKKSAVVHSVDTISDLALVKLDDAQVFEDGEALPIMSIGTSSKVRTGEFVIAIGSPMQLQNSASFGIVSATARHASELGISNNRSEYIQTDVAVNTGNSGGPLVNLDGEVIGINTMKAKGADGISFAIPIDVAMQIIKQLLSNKKVVRPYVGLKMANAYSVPNEGKIRSSRRNGLPAALTSTKETKVVVLDVVRGSPAHMAGLQR